METHPPLQDWTAHFLVILQKEKKMSLGESRIELPGVEAVDCEWKGQAHRSVRTPECLTASVAEWIMSRDGC